MRSGARGPTAIHSFMSLPWPGSKYSASPALTSSATRSRGSFTTNAPCEDMNAKSLPFTFRPVEPKPLPPRVTDRSFANAFTTRANPSSMAARSFFVRVVLTRTTLLARIRSLPFGRRAEDADSAHQLFTVERLGKRGRGTDAARELPGAGHAADDDDRRRPGGTPAVLRRELVAAHPVPQVEIEHEDVGVVAELVGDRQRLVGVARDPDGELVGIPQRRRDGRERVGIVLDDEDPHPVIHRRRGSREAAGAQPSERSRHPDRSAPFLEDGDLDRHRLRPEGARGHAEVQVEAANVFRSHESFEFDEVVPQVLPPRVEGPKVM